MKRLALILFIMQIVILSPAYALPPVLMYHDIKAVPVNGFDVSTRAFCEQLDYLMSEGYTTLSLEEFKAEMSGIFSTTVNLDTIDEAPMAYKTMDDIVANIAPTAEVVKVIKPIYNFKAGDE